jgi:hypothetical protein
MVGQPKAWWIDVVNYDMRMTRAGDWKIGTKDRIKWRKILEEAIVFLRP